MNRQVMAPCPVPVWSGLARTGFRPTGCLLVVLATVTGCRPAQQAGASPPAPATLAEAPPSPEKRLKSPPAEPLQLPDIQPRLGLPLSGLSAKERDRFEKGQATFNRSFKPEEGLGPSFNLFSCAACHSNPLGGSGTLTVTYFGRVEDGRFDPLEELGGPLHESDANDPACAERIPPEANFIAHRIATSALGAGLIQAVPDEAIEAGAHRGEGKPAGKVSRVTPYETPGGPKRVGRFGWKCQQATIESFSAHAAVHEMGITNRLFADEPAPNSRTDLPASCDPVSDPEDRPDREGVDMLTRWVDFLTVLAPPPQTPRAGLPGEAIFERIGCADCHRPSFEIGDDPSVPRRLQNRTLRPYSDFLLHDMGPSGDGIAQGDAGRFEMRTSPLWGFRVRFPAWHDGRVTGKTLRDRFVRAVEAHDGAAAQARDEFRRLSGEELAQLVAFIDSLGRAEFDFDGDNDVDLGDFASTVTCFASDGEAVRPVDRCALADVDQDADVDLIDMALFQRAFSGNIRGSAMAVP